MAGELPYLSVCVGVCPPVDLIYNCKWTKRGP